MSVKPPLPEDFVNLAWVMSGKYSKNLPEQDDASLAEDYLKTLLTQVRSVSSGYADDITSLLFGNKRTFSLIVRHRDYLFDRIEVLKSNEVKINQQLQSFSLSLQGTFPRLAGIAIGGTTLPLLISQVFPFLSSATSTLLLVLSGGIGYIAAELISGYIGGKGLNDAITKFENEKDTVYLEFMANSRSALRLLFNNVISSYANNAIDATYARTPQQRDEIVDNIMKAAMLKSPCSKCVSCGTALARNSNFCDKCGTKQTS